MTHQDLIQRIENARNSPFLGENVGLPIKVAIDSTALSILKQNTELLIALADFVSERLGPLELNESALREAIKNLDLEIMSKIKK